MSPLVSDRGIVAIGSDHAGFSLKERLKGELERLGYHVLDKGADSEEPCDYPDFAEKVALAVRRGEAEKGVLICGTGAGMAMVANKVPGIRAAACNELFTARHSRAHNDANILTMGARVIGGKDASAILETFMGTPFEGKGEGGERHVRRLGKLSDLEKKFSRGGRNRKIR